jgi:predicted 3-demethylubiquinone-9 3-methyltransferase (glyoxalase superfamily)/uncharacterized protein YndB with AHSA1/START domain
MTKMQRISPFLWFHDQAEEAANLYTSIFKNSKINHVMRQGDRVFLVSFTLDGQPMKAMNGGPMYQFSEACSFAIHCKNQKEVDHYWNSLTADGGTEGQCGWLKDKFGLSWQVVPEALPNLLNSSDPAVAKRAQANMLQMRKINIRQLTREPKNIKITVQTLVHAPIERAWEVFTQPAYIMQWNHASPDWHCPNASNDLRVGGKLFATMAAKDGSFAFDFEGIYSKVEPLKTLVYGLADGRQITVRFKAKGKKTEVIEVFDAEHENPAELQRGGWQAILDHYKACAEQAK